MARRARKSRMDSMKKFLIILATLCVCVGVVIGAVTIVNRGNTPSDGGDSTIDASVSDASCADSDTDGEPTGEGESDTNGEPTGEGESDTAAAVHTHTFAPAETQTATCVSDGFAMHQCKVCAQTYVEPLFATGHTWGDWEALSAADCTTTGSECRRCAACSATEQRDIPALEHSYTAVQSVEENGIEWTVYRCAACSAEARLQAGQSLSELYEEAAVLDAPTNYDFYIVCNGSEADVRRQLTVIDAYFEGSEYATNDEVVQAYTLEALPDAVWKVTPTHVYDDGTTYVATVSGTASFRDYAGDTLRFTTADDGLQEAELQDTFRFLSVMEENDPGYYPYSILCTEESEYAYATVGKVTGLSAGMILCLGDARTVNDLLQAAENDYFIGKIVSFYPNGDDTWTIVLGQATLSEIFSTLNISQDITVDFTDEDIEWAEDAEQQVMAALYDSEEYIEFLASVSIASEQYLKARGLSSAYSSPKSMFDRIKITPTFQKTDKGFTVVLNGVIDMPVRQNETSLGSITISFTATVDVYLQLFASGEVKKFGFVPTGTDNFSVLVTQTTIFRFEFDISLNIDYDLSEKEYVINRDTLVLHSKSCPSLRDDTKVDKLSEQELLKYIKEGFTECKRCRPYTRLSNTCFLVNDSTKTFHTATCSHTKNGTFRISHQSADGLVSTHYSPCADCRPDQAPRKEFNELIADALNCETWDSTVQTITQLAKQSGLSDKGNTKYITLAHVPMSFAFITGELNVRVFLTFDLSATLNYTYETGSYTAYGLYQTHDGFEPWFYKTQYEPTHTLFMVGSAHLKVGLSLSFNLSVFHLNDYVYVEIAGAVGVYADAYGVFKYTTAADTQTYAAYYMELGLFVTIDASAKLFKRHTLTIVNEKFPLLRIGYDKAYYAYVNTPERTAVYDWYDLNELGIWEVRYFDLKSLSDGTEVLEAAGEDGLYDIRYELSSGQWCWVENGMLRIASDAPDTFTDVLTVTVCGRAQWNDYREGNGIFYLGSVSIPIYGSKPPYSVGLSFTSNGDGTCYVSGIGTCTDTDVRIPPTSPDWETVVKIGYNAFENCTNLTSVTIPDGVNSIGNNAFEGCTGLTSVTIPGSVTSIGDHAFFGCRGLASVTIPDGVIRIGFWAFRSCYALTSVTIPNSVTYIDDGAFSGCPGLTSIYVDDGNSVYYDDGNCIIHTATRTLIVGCQTSIIPSHGNVAEIGNYAFNGCFSLASITIPDGVTSIGYRAFSYCINLNFIQIPDSVTEIEDYAFAGCFDLTSVTIPYGVTHIGGHAFEGCSGLTSITYEGTVSDWNSISKDYFWNYDSAISTVICTDGSVSY